MPDFKDFKKYVYDNVKYHDLNIVSWWMSEFEKSLNSEPQIEARSVQENEDKKKKYHQNKCTHKSGWKFCPYDRKCVTCWYYR